MNAHDRLKVEDLFNCRKDLGERERDFVESLYLQRRRTNELSDAQKEWLDRLHTTHCTEGSDD